MSDIFTVATQPSPTDNSMQWISKATPNKGQPVFGIAPFGNVQYSVLTLTAAQIKALSGTPITLLAAPGTGLSIQILDAVFKLNFGTTQFAAGSTVQILQNSIAVATTTATLINGGSSVLIQPAFPGIGTSASLGASNSAVTVGVAGANFTTGDSTVDVHLWYSVIND